MNNNPNKTTETNQTTKDFTGQVKTVKVSTKGAAADYGVKEIPADRNGSALRKTLLPTPKSGDCK